MSEWVSVSERVTKKQKKKKVPMWERVSSSEWWVRDHEAKKKVPIPGVEPGAQPWKGWMLPLHHIGWSAARLAVHIFVSKLKIINKVFQKTTFFFVGKNFNFCALCKKISGTALVKNCKLSFGRHWIINM